MEQIQPQVPCEAPLTHILVNQGGPSLWKSSSFKSDNCYGRYMVDIIQQ